MISIVITGTCMEDSPHKRVKNMGNLLIRSSVLQGDISVVLAFCCAFVVVCVVVSLHFPFCFFLINFTREEKLL